jgi:hypothetical protein
MRNESLLFLDERLTTMESMDMLPHPPYIFTIYETTHGLDMMIDLGFAFCHDEWESL